MLQFKRKMLPHPQLLKKKQESKQTSEKANKQESKQNVVFAIDKCRFGSDVHDFIVLKYGQ